ncbi:hypothetical protein DASC09_057990 [Saccharomycopsis crataegensis]|uniref:V-type proton ATPase subunit S1/VOA1 transmembrane domain-containing protein n=1 Tax=Saccharomycopsis crataegensis TaxID=43959 RepID=A0AAV5QV36_9ASCO|nr:hypothetical protein DASC09_057990 [Saccharomycopsis crataegensis]
MKWQQILVMVSASSVAWGFKNTGPVYIQNVNSDNSKVAPHYMDESKLMSEIGELVENSSSSHVARTVIFQLKKSLFDSVSNDAHFQDFISNAQHTPKVLYHDDNNQQEYFKSFTPVSISSINESEEDLIVDDISEVTIEEFGQALSGLKNTNVVVQFIPANNKPVDEVYQKINNEVAKNLVVQKREISGYDIEVDNDDLLEEMKNTFSKLIEDAKQEGGVVTISDEDSEDLTDSSKDIYYDGYSNEEFEEIKVTSGSVFETHQFFSSGILSATIVSLFLVYVLIQGLSWVSSLQVSYRALERPVDANKKTK